MDIIILTVWQSSFHVCLLLLQLTQCLFAFAATDTVFDTKLQLALAQKSGVCFPRGSQAAMKWLLHGDYTKGSRLEREQGR